MHVIGIDLGGTKIEGVLLNSKGKILKKKRVPTQANKSRSIVVNDLIEVVKYLSLRDVYGVGIGTPGFSVNGKLSLIKNVPSLNGFNLKKELIRRIGLRNIEVENDANCFTLAEYKFGAGKGTKNMVGIIMGTGIGSGLIIDGKLHTGRSGGAGEIGHMVLHPHGRKCSCGGRGHFEAYASGPALVKHYKFLKGRIKNPNPKSIFLSKEKIAKRVVDEYINMVGIGFANIISIFNPDRIVLGGGVSNLGFYRRIIKSVKSYSNPDISHHIDIVRYKLGDSSGVIGAASLVMK
jgi:predicted NBD/HSP70 family sugar kinase